MRIDMVKLLEHPINCQMEFKVKSLEEIPKGKALEEDTVMAIDPGNNSLGFSIGMLDNPTPFLAGKIVRDRNNDIEKDTYVYMRFVTQVLIELAKSFNVKEAIIEEQYLDPRYEESFRKLTSLRDGIDGELTINNIKTYGVEPQTWKSGFLQDYKIKYNINLTKSNKEWVQRKARELFRNMYHMKGEDASDSLGILYYYYRRIYKDKKDGIIRVVKEMTREYKHSIGLDIGPYKDVDEVIRKAEDIKNKYARSNVKLFEANTSMNLDDNLRALTSESNDVFVAFVKPFLLLMPDLFRFQEKIGKIDEDSLLYIIALRTNKK